jgi:Zn-dependent membrane protease YugP
MVYFIVIALLSLFGPHFWAKRILQKYNQKEYFSGNGIELARMLIEHLELSDVDVDVTDTADHYDPEKKVIRLTQATCGRRTLTAVVVAAHEVGHAIQDKAGYKPLQMRTRLVLTAARFERVGAALMMAVPVIAVLTRIPSTGLLMFLSGLLTLFIPVIVHALTLPTEFDASFNRALPLLSSGKYIPPEDIPAAKRILRACSLTYVANSLVGLLNIWRWIRILRR